MNPKTIRRAALWGTIALWAGLAVTCANAHTLHPEPPPSHVSVFLGIAGFSVGILTMVCAAAAVLIRLYEWVGEADERAGARHRGEYVRPLFRPTETVVAGAKVFLGGCGARGPAACRQQRQRAYPAPRTAAESAEIAGHLALRNRGVTTGGLGHAPRI
jgi:hypothetical protein